MLGERVESHDPWWSCRWSLAPTHNTCLHGHQPMKVEDDLYQHIYWTSQTLWFLKFPSSLLRSNLYACEFELELSNPTVSSSLRTIPFWKCSNRILLYSLAMTSFIQSWKIASTQWLKKGVKLSQVIGWKENYNSKPSCWSI